MTQIAVRLTPRAGKDAIGGCWIDADGQHWLSVSVTAPPDRGKANKALIALLARQLSCPAASISLVAGATSRLKRLTIAGADERIMTRIRDWMERD